MINTQIQDGSYTCEEGRGHNHVNNILFLNKACKYLLSDDLYHFIDLKSYITI